MDEGLDISTHELIGVPAIDSETQFVQLIWGDDAPVSLAGIDASNALMRHGVPLVEIFNPDQQRTRTSQAYYRSEVGSRLRYVRHVRSEHDDASVVVVTQSEHQTGITAHTTITHPHGTRALRISTTIENSSSSPFILSAIGSATFGFGQGEGDLDHLDLYTASSEWLAESRWRRRPLREELPFLNLALHGQDGRGHFAVTSHGAWSTGENIPVGVIVDARTDESISWQIETSGAWHFDLTETIDGGVATLLGPTDLEHQFTHELGPGQSFTAVPVALTASSNGVDGAVAELTRYRRWLRERRSIDEQLPIVYNDFMNTLMGQPTSDALHPLIDAAADAGAEYFCIDAGWFAEPAVGDWWSTVGEWRVAPTRFPHGLSALINHIHARGMRSGLWLEPEVVGVDSATASALPDEAFFTRGGRRIAEHGRFHLDFRHVEARRHLDDTVDHLVRDFGVSYFKLDYNINPGAGTDWFARSAGDGLLAHTRAFAQWLRDVQKRHPEVLFENCSSGAMRADYSLLSIAHLQSTSDQQDFRLYPPIAASSPASILPEQCGNWAYPQRDMTDEETAFTLVTGLSGRLYLSGFLDDLRETQSSLVAEAVALHKALRARLPESEPFWPLGLPRWDDPVVCLGLRGTTSDLLFIWDRAAHAQTLTIPRVSGEVVALFPSDLQEWRVDQGSDALRIDTVAGTTARVFEVRHPPVAGHSR